MFTRILSASLLLIVGGRMPAVSQEPSEKSQHSAVVGAWLERIGEERYTQCGLSKLSDEQLTALDSVMTELVSRERKPTKLTLSMNSMMRNDGWEEVRIEWQSIEDRTWLVVKGRRDYGTRYAPDGVDEMRLPSGTYWGRRRISGLAEILDLSGYRRSLVNCTWVEMPKGR